MQDDGQLVERYTPSVGEDRVVSETLEEMADRLGGGRGGENISNAVLNSILSIISINYPY